MSTSAVNTPTASATEQKPRKPPKLWHYLLGATLTLVLLVFVWVCLVVLLIQPPSLMQENPSVSKLFVWLVVGPLVVVGALFGTRWIAASNQVKQADTAREVLAKTQATQASEQAHREYVLEVISLGVTLDKYRQGKLWEALSTGHTMASIREQDPKKYEWSASDREGLEGTRSGDALENGIKFTPMYWGAPSFGAHSHHEDAQNPVSITNPVIGLPAAASSVGLSFNLFIAAGWEMAERPDRVLERVFKFFDDHPDVPYVVLSGADGLYFRNLYRPPGTPPLIKDGHYIPEMPDSSALFVLARRERVEPIRPFAFEDADETKMRSEQLNHEGYARRLALAHIDLSEAVPKPKGSPTRTPTVAEWLPAAAAFAKRGDIYDHHVSMLDVFTQGKRPSNDFKPTPWFPLPWNKEQLADFDKLPTLGFVHRPVFVKTVDEHGAPLSRRDARVAALSAGWQQALQTLPEAARKTAPARVVLSAGGNVEQTIALSSVLNTWAAQGGPELKTDQPTQWIDTHARLGNTGAATWFMQMAIGVMGSYRQGGTSAAINLRDPAEASIVFITPPSEEKRKTQQHPSGGADVFRHHSSPAIDPKNYEPH
jgi:hypothetical protein